MDYGELQKTFHKMRCMQLIKQPGLMEIQQQCTEVARELKYYSFFIVWATVQF